MGGAFDGGRDLNQPLTAPTRSVMRVSIVVPSYQQAAFLPATLASLEAQAGVELEIIIQDGGSTDGSVEIIREFAARSVAKIIWESRSDGGQSPAINCGLRKATGEIVGYLNSDDVLYPGALAAVAACFNREPATMLVYGNGDYLDAAGGVLSPYPVEAWDLERLRLSCYICQPACFWRRELHGRLGWFDETLWGAFDYDFWLRVGRHEQAAHLDRALAGSRCHTDAKTFSQRGRLWEEAGRVQARHNQGRIALPIARNLAAFRAEGHLGNAMPAWASRVWFGLKYWWAFMRLRPATGEMGTLDYWKKWLLPPYAKSRRFRADPLSGLARRS